jgi:hypothetical protein
MERRIELLGVFDVPAVPDARLMDKQLRNACGVQRDGVNCVPRSIGSVGRAGENDLCSKRVKSLYEFKTAPVRAGARRERIVREKDENARHTM